jgi:hypothetical protein
MLEEEHSLSFGMLMHVKCIHDLHSLLSYILSYLIVYEDLDMFSIDSRDFINDPLSFGFDTEKQICLFCMFVTFRDLPNVKRNQPSCHVIFLGNRRL